VFIESCLPFVKIAKLNILHDKNYAKIYKLHPEPFINAPYQNVFVQKKEWQNEDSKKLI